MARAEAPHPYFVNFWVDGFFLGFVSIALFVYFRFLDVQGPFTPWHWTLAQATIWGLNWPHVCATNVQLYGSAQSRRQFPMTAYAIPIFMLLIGALALQFPQAFAPYLVKIMILWASFHYSGQTIGLTLLYARKSGLNLDPWMRTCVVAFAYCTFLNQICALEAFSIDLPYSAISFPLLGIPGWVSKVFFAASLALIAALLLAYWQLRRRNLSVPLIIGLPLVVQYLWFVVGANVYSFQLFVSSFHSLQYLLIAWSMQMALRDSRSVTAPIIQLLRKTALWLPLIFGGGFTLFYLIPLGLTKFGWEFSFVSVVVYSVLQIHHFFVDGVIWKLRDHNISRFLMGNVWTPIKNESSSP